MERLKKYPKYKPSGIEWLGEIPEHWELKKLKYEAKIQGGYAFKSEEFVDNGMPVVRIGDISTKINLEDCKKTSETNISDEFKLKKYDTLIALSGATVGKMCFIEEDINAYINQRVAKVNNGSKYLHFILTSNFFIEQIFLAAGGSAQENISTNTIGNFIIPLPPLPEQTAIANFLDEKTAKIDSLIEKKKKLIELYKEERTAVINHYVLGQHLIDNSQLTIDNGQLTIDNSQFSIINYQLPPHWEVKKLKYVCKFEYGESLSVDQREEGNIPVFGSNGITGYHKNAITLSPCIIVGRKGSFGKVNWSDKECFPIDTTYFIDKNKTAENLRFIYFLLITLNLDSISKDTGVPGLNREDAYSNLVSIPPLEEQQQIVEYIESETKRIDDKITRAEKEIELLQEYRTALISEVVTGKIKV